VNRETIAHRDLAARTAIRFVIMLGIVSLFADMTYEGARSITGPYLLLLGASGTVVGFVAGFGELVGYAIRLLSGYLADRLKKYWAITILGYVVNLLAVPLLAIAGQWQFAVVLMILERTGKAIRTPARDAMLSHATEATGRGWGFGLHEAMDQAGATIGPLVVAGVLYLRHDYKLAFAILLVPALFSIATLLVARAQYPRPSELEIRTPPPMQGRGLPRRFWIYVAAASLVAAGFTDYPLIAFHLQKEGIIAATTIPILYALAMLIDAGAALVFGRLFDRVGIPALALATLLSAFFAPLAFFGGRTAVVIGIVLWGIGLGSQESIMRAAIAEMVGADRRATAYGILNTAYGVCWFLGSLALGVLYDHTIKGLVAFSIICQLVAIPLFLAARAAKTQTTA
jgi:MFS family permease